jgi:EAL domain-containing protein (putative c-di-GMP-specific phosphodiesterase class I)
VNVPYRILDDPELAAGVAGLLESGLQTPVELTFEVVPSGPGAGAELDRLALERLVRLGVRLSLDDFGRASSFVALTKLPLQEVKIDAAFVHGLGRSRHDDAIVRSLVHLAHELGLLVVAEGVETQAAWDASLAIGCDRAQGFYVVPPLPGHELTVWLESSWPAVSARAG